MNFKHLLTVIAKENLAEKILASKNAGTLTISKKEFKEIWRVIQHESNTNKRFLPLLNCLFLSITYNPSLTFSEIKRKGLLRYSKYYSGRNIAISLALSLKDFCQKLAINNDYINYLESIIHFGPAFDGLKYLKNDILNEYNKFKKIYNVKEYSFSKTLLAFADYLFLISFNADRSKQTNDLSYYSKEEICEAISFLLSLIEELEKDKAFTESKIADNYIADLKIEKRVLSACLFKEIKELEILIDNFGFVCTIEGRSCTVKAGDPLLEKSIRLGYIRNELQYFNDRIDFSEALPLSKLVELLAELRKDINPFEYTNTFSYPRYVIKFPDTLMSFLNENFFGKESLFKEEVEYLAEVFKEQLLTLEKLKEIIIKDDLTIFEFIKIKRVFIFMSFMFAINIFKQKNKNTNVILRSLLPSIKKDILISQFIGKVASKEKAETFLELVTWNVEEKMVLDLQYQSLIKNGDRYIIPLNLFSNSNTIRNLFSTEYKKNNHNLFLDGANDPVTEILSKAFKKQGFEVYVNITYAVGEMDFIATYNDFAFVAECKHSLNPTSVYELRTSFDYIQKANNQLNKFSSEIEKPEVRKYFLNKIGVDFSKINTIKSAIVLSNRMFYGYRLDHPILAIHELLNFVIKGEFRTEKGNFLMWNDSCFSVQDFMEYIDGKNKAINLLHDSMLDKEIKYSVGKTNFRYLTYVLNRKEFEDRLNAIAGDLKKIPGLS